MVSSGSRPNVDSAPAWAEALVAAAGVAGIGVAVSVKSTEVDGPRWVFASQVAIDLAGTTAKELLGHPVEPSFIGDAYFSPESLVDQHSSPHVRSVRGELIRSDLSEFPSNGSPLSLSQEGPCCVCIG